MPDSDSDWDPPDPKRQRAEELLEEGREAELAAIPHVDLGGRPKASRSQKHLRGAARVGASHTRRAKYQVCHPKCTTYSRLFTPCIVLRQELCAPNHALAMQRQVVLSVEFKHNALIAAVDLAKGSKIVFLNQYPNAAQAHAVFVAGRGPAGEALGGLAYCSLEVSFTSRARGTRKKTVPEMIISGNNDDVETQKFCTSQNTCRHGLLPDGFLGVELQAKGTTIATHQVFLTSTVRSLSNKSIMVKACHMFEPDELEDSLISLCADKGQIEKNARDYTRFLSQCKRPDVRSGVPKPKSRTIAPQPNEEGGAGVAQAAASSQRSVKKQEPLLCPSPQVYVSSSWYQDPRIIEVSRLLGVRGGRAFTIPEIAPLPAPSEQAQGRRSSLADRLDPSIGKILVNFILRACA